MVSMRSLNPQRWLDAFTDHHSTIYTFSRCITLANLNGDGDYKLIVADLGTGSACIKLKVFKGTSLMTENNLIDTPTGVESFFMDLIEPRVPAVAVSSGPNVYIYKNMRPYFKFTVPSLEVNPLEEDLWLQVREKAIELDLFYELLQNIRQEIGFTNLTSRSQQFLMLEHNKRKMFIDEHKVIPIKKQTAISCLTTLRKSMIEEDGVSCLVVGTENGKIIILDPEAFTVLENVPLCGAEASGLVPAQISSSGLYDVEFRLICLCRDGRICLIRRGWNEAKVLTHLMQPAVSMVVIPDGSNSIVTALMDNTIHCFSKKGRKQWQIQLDKAIMCMAEIPIRHLGQVLIAVSLMGGVVQFYCGRQLVDSIIAPDTVSAMKFGHFGLEEHSLILVTVAGCLLVKILKRTASFVAQSSNASHIPDQQIKMILPKKTRLFVEQTMRERGNAIAMHHTFQHNLFKLRLHAARSCVQALQSCSSPLSSKEPLKLTAQVLGLGPKFTMAFTLENMSKDTPSKDLGILLHCDEKLYSVNKPFIQVPLLIPGLTYKFDTTVESVSELGVPDQIRVFITKGQQSEPLLSVIINMPDSDMIGL